MEMDEEPTISNAKVRGGPTALAPVVHEAGHTRRRSTVSTRTAPGPTSSREGQLERVISLLHRFGGLASTPLRRARNWSTTPQPTTACTASK